MRRPLPFHSNNVWPPLIMLIPFVILYGMLIGSFRLIRIFAGAPAGVVVEDIEDVRNIESGFLAVAAGVYAIYRVWRFHPRCNFAYLGWLRLVPWTAARALPLGPVHPVWQDVVVIGVLAAITRWQSHGNFILPVMAFGFTYLSLMTMVLLWTQRRAVCVMLGFLWPALMLPQLTTVGFDLVVAAIVVVIWFGHRQSLRAFPWTTRDQPTKPPASIFQKEIQVNATGAPPHVGWPMIAVGPKIKPSSIGTQTAFWLSALFGWWSFCIIECAGDELPPEVIILFAFFAVAIRIGIYCSNIVPPFNIWGRMSSGRFIVPGFDRVFVTPLAVMLISIVGGIVIRRSGPWYSAVESIVIALCWFVLFDGGPSRKNWVLTGYLRFRPSRRVGQKAALRQV